MLEQEVFERAISVFPEPHRHYLRRNVWLFVLPGKGPSVCCRWRHNQSGQTFDIIALSRYSLRQGPQSYLNDFFHEVAHVLLMHLGRPELKDRNFRRKAEWQATNLAFEWRKAAGEAVSEIFEEFIPKFAVLPSEEKAPEEVSSSEAA